MLPFFVMLGRILGVGVITALAGCYSAPEPDCGFSCGPGGACPADYTCAADHVCHRNGAAAGLTCPGRPDAGIDSGIDAPPGPQAILLDPARDMTGVSVSQIVHMTVDRDIMGVTGTTFFLTQNATAVPGMTDYPMSSLMASIRPALQLAPLTLYTVFVGPGITDASGAEMQPFQWSFTTGPDTQVPNLVQSVPFNGQSNVQVSTDITLYFDEPVSGVDITSVTVSDGGTPIAGTISSLDTHTYRFTPTVALTAATLYMVSLGNQIQDQYGNAFTPLTFSFTTQ